MKRKKTNWTNNPTKKQLILITTAWILGNMLLILSITDLFTESFFQRNYIMMYLLMIGSTLATFNLYRNFLKHKTN